jgi:hypothetical protein
MYLAVPLDVLINGFKISIRRQRGEEVEADMQTGFRANLLFIFIMMSRKWRNDSRHGNIEKRERSTKM